MVSPRTDATASKDVPRERICTNCGRQHECLCDHPEGVPCCGTSNAVDCCGKCPCECWKRAVVQR